LTSSPAEWPVAIVVMVLGAILAAGTPARASMTSRGDQYYTPPTRHHNNGNYAPGCRNVDIKLHYDYEGVYSDKKGSGTHRQAFFHRDEFSASETWKLKGTHEVLLSRGGSLVYEEVAARRVPSRKSPRG
jgi:hypothetical protein